MLGDTGLTFEALPIATKATCSPPNWPLAKKTTLLAPVRSCICADLYAMPAFPTGPGTYLINVHISQLGLASNETFTRSPALSKDVELSTFLIGCEIALAALGNKTDPTRTLIIM